MCNTFRSENDDFYTVNVPKQNDEEFNIDES
jgi:hypothetical protein